MNHRSGLVRTFACILIGTSLVHCGSATPEAKKVTHRERAVAYFEKGQYHEATIEYRNVAQLDPRDADAHYRLALCYLKLGGLPNLYQAFNELTRTVELDKVNQDARLKLGELYLLGHEPTKAQEHANSVLIATPDNTDALILRGQSLIAERQFKEGIVDLKKAIDLNPKKVPTYIILARVYSTLKDRVAAEASLNQALLVNPRSLETLLAFADLHDLTGQPERAEARYKEALDIDPDNEAVYLKLASYYQRHTKVAEAEATLERLATRKPHADAPQIYLGDYYTVNGQLDNALTSYRRAAEMNPSSTTARHKLIAHYLDTGKNTEAETLVASILEKDKKDFLGRFFDSRIKLGRSKTDEAITVLQGLLKDNPQFPGAHYFLGIAYMHKQQLPQARAAVADAIKFNPQFGEAHTALAQIHLAEGSVDLAIEQAQAALQINPRNAQATITSGTAYLRKGNLVKSRAMFEPIAQAFPKEPIGPFHLGLVAHAEKNDGKALAYFEDALARRPTAIDPLVQIVAIKDGQGKTQEARERVVRQLDLAPKSPLLHNLLGQLQLRAKDFPQAEKSFKTAIDLDSSFLASFLNLAQSYYQADQVEQAILEYEAVLTKSPGDVTALMMLGIIHEGRKEHDKAKQRYEQILKLNPHFAPAANNLAWILVDHGGNLDVALGYAQSAREYKPDDPRIADTLGWIYFKKNTSLLAVSLLKEAAEKLPNEPLVHYHLGIVQAQNGEVAAAKHALQTALKLNQHFTGAEDAKKTLSGL